MSALGPIQVVGSRSGAHAGTLLPDSDGQGGSFIPSTPFTAGETVTVTTQLNVIGGLNGQFSFRVENPAPQLPPAGVPRVSAGSNGLQHFRSRPDLTPASITVTRNSAPASNGDIFLTPQFGPTQNGPMILDPSGRLVWFQPDSDHPQHAVHRLPRPEPPRPAGAHLVAGEHERGQRSRRRRDLRPELPRDRHRPRRQRARRRPARVPGHAPGAGVHHRDGPGPPARLCAGGDGRPGPGDRHRDRAGHVQLGRAGSHPAVDVVQLRRQRPGPHPRSVPSQLGVAGQRRQPDRLGPQHLRGLQDQPPDRPDHLDARRQEVELQDGPRHHHGVPARRDHPARRHDHDVRRRRRPAPGPPVLARRADPARHSRT